VATKRRRSQSTAPNDALHDNSSGTPNRTGVQQISPRLVLQTSGKDKRRAVVINEFFGPLAEYLIHRVIADLDAGEIVHASALSKELRFVKSHIGKTLAVFRKTGKLTMGWGMMAALLRKYELSLAEGARVAEGQSAKEKEKEEALEAAIAAWQVNNPPLPPTVVTSVRRDVTEQVDSVWTPEMIADVIAVKVKSIKDVPKTTSDEESDTRRNQKKRRRP
jgi:hypothetical protein